MSQVSPTRPSRRAAAQKKVLPEDSEEDELPVKDEEEGEEFTPAPERSPRRQVRRKTTDATATPQQKVKARSTRPRDSIEPSRMLYTGDSVQNAGSPTKRASPRKRKSIAPSRKSRASIAVQRLEVDEKPPEIANQQTESALNDITRSIINEQPPATDIRKDFIPIKPMDTQLEKPMDIVIRSRALPAPVLEEAGPKPRTVITNLILSNFKSYAGRQEIGPFHASFSSVVGPNGSGKSNVIDSLLFVFGFRASKMRQGKISALIHNSAAFPDLDYCEVEVHFQEVIDQVSLALDPT